MAVQAADKDHAIRAARGLRALHAAHVEAAKTPAD
jgi:hypothetical protein